MILKRQKRVHISKDHKVFPVCDEITGNGLNLYNAALFRRRQVLTARQKDVADLTENEQTVIDEFKTASGVDILSDSFKGVSAQLLEETMRKNGNPDYCNSFISAQTAQWVVKSVINDWKNAWSAINDWVNNPSKYKAKPELPKYKRKGGHCTVVMTNQDCTIATDKNNVSWLKLPYHKKTPVCIGMPEGRLKEVKIKPVNGEYDIIMTFDIEAPDVQPVTESKRIAAIDFGVDNLMAVTNNIGASCLLYKGGIVKSVNQNYNKKLAALMAAEMAKPGCHLAKDGKPRFVPTTESQKLTNRRNNQIHDFMRQAAVHFLAWCVENRIDTIVCGVNKGWKQEVSIGKANTQNFVQIPFMYLRQQIRYRAEAAGIRFIEQEESYTSKASFPDMDDIPVYKEGEPAKYKFSGRRRPTRYKGTCKKDGFRGLYVCKDGTIINSDLNGSANILRKAFPDAFKDGVMPDFTKTTIIRHPAREFALNNEMQQKKAGTVISNAKAKRMKKKLTKSH